MSKLNEIENRSVNEQAFRKWKYPSRMLETDADREHPDDKETSRQASIRTRSTAFGKEAMKIDLTETNRSTPIKFCFKDKRTGSDGWNNQKKLIKFI